MPHAYGQFRKEPGLTVLVHIFWMDGKYIGIDLVENGDKTKSVIRSKCHFSGEI